MTPRFFYGWWIVAAAVLLQFVFLGVSQSTVSVFLRPVVEELGWQVWQFTLGSSLGVLAGALSGVIVGRVVDQRGPRLPVLAGALVSAICLWSLGRQSNLWLFWTLHLCAGFIGWTLFGPLVVNTTINKWFIRRRGWALAIGSSGISFGGLIAPFAMTLVVDSLGWRNGYLVQALFVLAVVAPIALVMRRTPEDAGLRPDGEPAPSEFSDAFPHEEETALLHQPPGPAYTRLLAAPPRLQHESGRPGFSTGPRRALCHRRLLYSQDGRPCPRRERTGKSAVQGRVGILPSALSSPGACRGRIFPGWHRRRPDAAFPPATAEQAFLFAGFFLYGFGFGGTIPISESLWVSYFGRAHIGAVRGVAQPLTVIGPTVAPVLVGVAYDLQGSYQLGFLGIIGVYLLAGLLVAVSRPPRTESTQ